MHGEERKSALLKIPDVMNFLSSKNSSRVDIENLPPLHPRVQRHSLDQQREASVACYVSKLEKRRTKSTESVQVETQEK
jgi:transcription termination factor Rho